MQVEGRLTAVDTNFPGKHGRESVSVYALQE
jgi:hypothetical protein